MSGSAQEARCAWCGHGAKRPAGVATHGLCETCRTRLCAELRSLLAPLAGSSHPETTSANEECVSESITNPDDDA
jgi:hypothetical protein